MAKAQRLQHVRTRRRGTSQTPVHDSALQPQRRDETQAAVRFAPGDERIELQRSGFEIARRPSRCPAAT